MHPVESSSGLRCAHETELGRSPCGSSFATRRLTTTPGPINRTAPSPAHVREEGSGEGGAAPSPAFAEGEPHEWWRRRESNRDQCKVPSGRRHSSFVATVRDPGASSAARSPRQSPWSSRDRPRSWRHCGNREDARNGSLATTPINASAEALSQRRPGRDHASSWVGLDEAGRYPASL